MFSASSGAAFLGSEAASGAMAASGAEKLTWAEIACNCNEMRSHPLFRELFEIVTEQVVPNKERQCLSHHTTASCRAKEAPIESLKAIGMDNSLHGSASHRMCRVALDFPHTFYSHDQSPMLYITRDCASHKEAQKEAALEVLTILLAAAPELVRMPEKCFTRRRDSIDELRHAARETHAKRRDFGGDPIAKVYGPWTIIIHDPDIHTQPAARRPSSYVGGTSDEDILATMATWFGNTGGLRASHLPYNAWMYLEHTLPPQGLVPFLERNKSSIAWWRHENEIWFSLRNTSTAACTTVLTHYNADATCESLQPFHSGFKLPATTTFYSQFSPSVQQPAALVENPWNKQPSYSRGKASSSGQQPAAWSAWPAASHLQKTTTDEIPNWKKELADDRNLLKIQYQ
jgi:hypothetical protein